MKLMDYVLREALRRREVLEEPRITLSTWEALGFRTRPPMGYKSGSDDNPMVLMSRKTGES